ncbi:zinc finger protein 282-like isoform X2 [Ambystoma mexicanum]|uniref:zinc finger protein 282-like isoform X2 n=1 Tax=Ambystoma mexicanum TaxID=8296 RepID=UPI0037E7B511
MSWRVSEDVIFQDASAYFSKDEWKLLHEWQKELYSNVMKEIHQALISLGPLIANTVFSLQSKEKQEVTNVGTLDSEQRRGVSSDTAASHEELRRIKREESLQLNHPRDTGEREVNNGPSTGFPFLDPGISLMKEEESLPIFIDHLGVEVRESCTNVKKAPSPGQDIISFHIKDEAASFVMDHPENKKMQSSSSATARDGIMNRGKNVGQPIESIKRKPPYRVSSRRTHAAMLPRSFKGANFRSQLLAEIYREKRGESSNQRVDVSSHVQNLVLHQGTSKQLVSQKYNEFEMNPIRPQFNNSPQNTQQNRTSYKCTECDKSYICKEELVRHKNTHSGARPYVCTDCGRSFPHKGNLMKHYRTHTGEKPYACTFCEKRFSRKDNLNGHIRMHTGERPYKCTDCDKSFTWKGDFNQHRRKHT